MPLGTVPLGTAKSYGDSDSDGQARGGRKMAQYGSGTRKLPTSSGLSAPAGTSQLQYPLHALDRRLMDTCVGTGQLLRGAVDDNGKNKAAALMVGIKLDLEAEVHLTARIKGDIAIGLY